MVNDSLAVTSYGGDRIAYYQVIQQRISDPVIVYTNLSKALPGKIEEIKYKYLMQQNEYSDIITTGMSGDDKNVFVPGYFYKSGSITLLSQKIITQLANVENIMAGQ